MKHPEAGTVCNVCHSRKGSAFVEILEYSHDDVWVDAKVTKGNLSGMGDSIRQVGDVIRMRVSLCRFIEVGDR
jgi:hypothetical protein